jgi:hypothetical protein
MVVKKKDSMFICRRFYMPEKMVEDVERRVSLDQPGLSSSSGAWRCFLKHKILKMGTGRN